VDFNIRVQVKSDGSGVVTDGVKPLHEPLRRDRVEEAMRQKEKGKITEIIAVTIGGAKCEETLRTALAFGADRAIHVKEEGDVSRFTARRARRDLPRSENPGLFLLASRRSTTTTTNAADARGVARSAAGDVRVEGRDGDGKAKVTREIDAGLETLEITLPADPCPPTCASTSRLSELPDIMKRRRKADRDGDALMLVSRLHRP